MQRQWRQQQQQLEELTVAAASPCSALCCDCMTSAARMSNSDSSQGTKTASRGLEARSIIVGVRMLPRCLRCCCDLVLLELRQCAELESVSSKCRQELPEYLRRPLRALNRAVVQQHDAPVRHAHAHVSIDERGAAEYRGCSNH